MTLNTITPSPAANAAVAASASASTTAAAADATTAVISPAALTAHRPIALAATATATFAAAAAEGHFERYMGGRRRVFNAKFIGITFLHIWQDEKNDVTHNEVCLRMIDGIKILKLQKHIVQLLENQTEDVIDINETTKVFVTKDGDVQFRYMYVSKSSNGSKHQNSKKALSMRGEEFKSLLQTIKMLYK